MFLEILKQIDYINIFLEKPNKKSLGKFKSFIVKYSDFQFYKEKCRRRVAYMMYVQYSLSKEKTLIPMSEFLSDMKSTYFPLIISKFILNLIFVAWKHAMIKFDPEKIHKFSNPNYRELVKSKIA